MPFDFFVIQKKFVYLKEFVDHGYLNAINQEIVINERQSEANKHITLMHELLHFVDNQVLHDKRSRKLLPHNWITYAAPLIVQFLVHAGVWHGLTKKQINAVMKKQEFVPKVKRRKK